jgi:hypothetical protein
MPVFSVICKKQVTYAAAHFVFFKCSCVHNYYFQILLNEFPCNFVLGWGMLIMCTAGPNEVGILNVGTYPALLPVQATKQL